MIETNETVTSSKRIYEGRVINLRIDTVLLPNGREATREIVEHSGAIAAVPMLGDGSIVLVRQHRQAAGGPLLEIPAGSVNTGEDIDECVRRELMEEIQLAPGKIQRLFSMFVAPGYSSEQIHVYLARDLVQQKAAGDDDEFINIETLALDDALRKIDDGEIRDAKSIAGLLYVYRMQSSGEL
jgi:ADP-ribose pyrophosphatase